MTRDPRIDPQVGDELRKKHTSYVVEYRNDDLLSCKVIGPSSSKSVTMTLGRWVQWARAATMTARREG